MSLSNIVINTAVAQANKSQHNYKLGAVIYSGEVVYSRGYNRNIPLILNGREVYIHAEMDAIYSASRKRIDFSKADLLVVRLNKSGEFCISKPCSNCQAAIQEVGLRSVMYIDHNGNFRRL